VAVAAHDSLFDGPGVGADLEHFEVVIGFEQQEVGASEVDSDGVGEIAQVSGNGDLDAFGFERESDGVGGIVRDGEAIDFDIADSEARSGLEEREARDEFAPGDGGRGQERAVDRDVELAGDGGDAGDVIGVLVGDEDGVDGFGIDIDGGETLEGFLAAQSGVDQDSGAAGGDQGGVAGAGRGEDGDLKDTSSFSKHDSADMFW
jgi:hypothetical protein